jgi:hypothetical protein
MEFTSVKIEDITMETDLEPDLLRLTSLDQDALLVQALLDPEQDLPLLLMGKIPSMKNTVSDQ